jgi:hypothetical protein
VRRSGAWAGAAACGAFVAFVWIRSASGQGGDPYRTAVEPFLAKNCYLCHNDKLKTANLNLEAYRNPDLAFQRPEVWEKVRDKLATGKMPPPGQPVPASAEVKAVTAWIDA